MHEGYFFSKSFAEFINDKFYRIYQKRNLKTFGIISSKYVRTFVFWRNKFTLTVVVSVAHITDHDIASSQAVRGMRGAGSNTLCNLLGSYLLKSQKIISR